MDVYLVADPQSMNYRDELPQWTTLNFLPWKKKITKTWLSIDIKKIFWWQKRIAITIHEGLRVGCNYLIFSAEKYYIEDTTGQLFKQGLTSV